jgi:HSP20 family molecular chaperone IbpA
MTNLISHSFETRYEAPADRSSVRIPPLISEEDAETGGSASHQFITRLRAEIHDAINRWLHWLRRRTSDMQDGSGQLSLFLATSPSIDLEETDDGIVALAELPGLDPKDFEIEPDGRRLILRGQQKRKREARSPLLLC